MNRASNVNTSVQSSTVTGNASVGSASGPASRLEYECVVYGVAVPNEQDTKAAELVRQRAHALCDDGCLRANVVHVQERVFKRKSNERTLSTSGGGFQEVRVRKIAGDQVQIGSKIRVCSAGDTKLLSTVENEERVEMYAYGLYQRSTTKKKLETPIRSVTRVAMAGDVLPFLEQMGFKEVFKTSYQSETLLNRENVQIELYRLTKDFKSSGFIVPSECSTVESSPLLINIRGIAATEADLEKTSRRVRAFANELEIGSPFQEVKLDHFVPAKYLR